MYQIVMCFSIFQISAPQDGVNRKVNLLTRVNA